MKIKKFIAPDIQLALQQIRQELGEDAVIVSTVKEPIRNIRDLLGHRNIEVTAAVDNVIQETSQRYLITDGNNDHGQQVQIEYGAAERRVNTELPVQIIPGKLIPSKLPEPILPIVGQEDNGWFKVVLQQEMDKGGNGMDNSMENNIENGIVLKWKKVFRYMEVNETVINNIFKDFAENNINNILDEDIFKIHIRNKIVDLLKPAYDKSKSARIYTFIGPSGVGKTITLAKLATKLKVVEKKEIGLISIFNHRFGVTDKLKFFGEIIGTPVDIVTNPAELISAVETHRNKEAVFIDTEGRPSKNRSQVLELQSFLGAVGEQQNICLVLSTPTKNRDLIRIANDFMPTGYDKIIMTKVDETDTYGSMLNLISNTGVPVVYVANGSNVPDDIERITPKRLAEILLGGAGIDEDY